VSTAVASTAVESGVLVSVAAATTDVGAPPASPYDASVVADAELSAGVAAGSVVDGGGASWNDVGSIPTLLDTIGVVLAVDEVGPPNDDGSTPTELATTGGGALGIVFVAAAEPAVGRIDTD
jgi:hypothetical protein